MLIRVLFLSELKIISGSRHLFTSIASSHDSVEVFDVVRNVGETKAWPSCCLSYRRNLQLHTQDAVQSDLSMLRLCVLRNPLHTYASFMR